MKKDNIKLDSLPALLPGSEYKDDDPDSYRSSNLLGLAIAIVVHAEKDRATKLQKQTLFNLWEEERKKVSQYLKKLAEFNYRQAPSIYSAPDDSEDPWGLIIQNWLHKSLFEAPDWEFLHSIILTQRESVWWKKLKDICMRAETSTEPFDAIAEIQKISEEFRTEQEQDTTHAKRTGIIAWLKNHPHSYGLIGGFIFLILFFVLGLFKAQWRPWSWGTAVIALLVLILSLLGGRSR